MVTNVVPSWAERRNEMRAPVAIHAQVRGVKFSSGKRVEVTDLSCAGCNLKSMGFAEGDPLWIHFSGLAPIRGTVRWSDERGAGVHFSQRLSRYVVDHISRGR
ncbi:PilZ domain-containing protein [Sphingomonas turrisvirgatae]|uniref:PilZ domain-containing protein n=1 Tax=Sphingomonas turrisvirgatae TaxID=1888892 RepID=A0A1E3LY34_9SPHN|nr:PilZ domain-containing protein [Sphingomonas turrisvirgatae]ODP38648.1 hypothetical protein BFL28_01030 [Sphingomonas turrisvirgatae]